MSLGTATQARLPHQASTASVWSIILLTELLLWFPPSSAKTSMLIRFLNYPITTLNYPFSFAYSHIFFYFHSEHIFRRIYFSYWAKWLYIESILPSLLIIIFQLYGYNRTHNWNNYTGCPKLYEIMCQLKIS